MFDCGLYLRDAFRENAGGDIGAARLQEARDLSRERDEDGRQDIGQDEVVALSYFRLHFLIVDKVAHDEVKTIRRDVVAAQVVFHCRDDLRVEVGADGMRCAEHQGQNGEDAAAGADIEDAVALLQMPSQGTDAELRGLMGAGAKGGAGVDAEGVFSGCGILIFLPGREDEDVVDVELVEELLPVVLPVGVVHDVDGNRAVADIGVRAEGRKSGVDGFPDPCNGR